MRRHFVIAVLVSVLAVGFTIPFSLPASADVGGGVSPDSNSIPAGTSTTVTGTFNFTSPVGSGNSVQISLTPDGGNTGSASLQWTTETFNGACTPAANTATSSISCAWTGGSGGTATISMTFSTSADASGSWTITPTWTRSSPAGGGNLTPATISVTPSVDLGITKAASAATVNTGDTLSYTLGYVNNGPIVAPSVRIQDDLPAGVAFVSVDNASCFESSGVVACNLGDLAIGASGEVVIETTVTALPGEDLQNEAEIFSLTVGDPDSTNNFASTNTPVVDPNADLSISKNADVTDVLPGDTVTFTIDYQNDGPNAATGVSISDVLPSGLTFDSSPDCTDLGSGVVNCDIGALASGASDSVTIVATVDDDDSLAGSTLTNAAGILGTEPDPDTANNTDSVDVTVSEIADISVSKSDDPDPVLPGATLTYTVNYQNDGPSSATSVLITDVLPSEVTFVSAGLGCAETSAGSGVVDCDLGTLDPGEGGSRTIVVSVDGGVSPGDVLTNAVAINMDPSIHDPDTANNQAAQDTTVQDVADLSIGKVDNFDPVPAGQQLEYTLNYDNAGPSDATNVEIVDTLPSGVTFVSATPFQGSCFEAAGVVTCDVGTVPEADPIRQITIVVDVDPTLADGSTLTNTATISGDQVDTNTDDNTATEDTTVVAVADVSITKDDALDPVLAGEQIVYTLEYQNNGPSVASNVQVVDTLPAGVVFVSAVADDGTCSEASGVVTCDLGTIAAGSPAGVITIVVDVPSDAAAGTVTNTATISTEADDTEPDNDSASADTTIEVEADLSIAKSDDVDPVAAGGRVVYTLDYANAGPSDATNVQVVDTLPAGVVFNNASPDAGSCAEASGTVTCDIGTLAPGAFGQITLIVDVPGNTPSGAVNNSVTISSDTPDPNSGDNSDTESTEVASTADLSVAKSGSPGEVSPGDDVIYTITYANAGPSTAVDTVVTDTLPSEVIFVSATPDAGTCAQLAGVVTCEIGDVVAGASGSIVIVVTIPSDMDAGSVTNVVDIDSATADPSPGNNAVAAAVEVLAAAVDPDDGDLPFTGIDARSLSAFGLTLLLGGFLLVGRRRGQQA